MAWNNIMVIDNYIDKLRSSSSEVLDYQLLQDGISGASVLAEMLQHIRALAAKLYL